MLTDEERRRLDEYVDLATAGVLANPDDEYARECLLSGLAGYPGSGGDPRRAEQIRWFLNHNPRHSVVRCPYGMIDPELLPAEFQELKARWLELLAATPDDQEMIEGAMTFIAADDLEEATAIVRSAVSRQPNEANLWFHLGRVSQDAAERYHAFDRADALGFRHPNLLHWLGKAALDAGNNERAEQCGRELLRQAEEEREIAGHTIEWPQRGSLFWQRAEAEGLDRETTRQSANARSDHAFHKHHGHILLGVVACRRGKLEEAENHLRCSAELQPDFRLSSYGPSLSLLRALLAEGRWEAGLEYLRQWKSIWDDPRADEWIAAVQTGRIP